jgi:hypothetical protein
MATEMLKAENDLLSIAIVCHIAHSRPIKFRKLNIVSYKSKQRNYANSYDNSDSTNLFENLNSFNGDNFDNKQQMTT